MTTRSKIFFGSGVLAVVAIGAWSIGGARLPSSAQHFESAAATAEVSPARSLASTPASPNVPPSSAATTAPVATPATGTPPNAGAKDERAAMLAALRETRACYESQACDFPRTDPRAYDFAVGRRLALDLSQLHARFGPDAAVAREFMAVEDGFVREEALRMFGELPPDDESLVVMNEYLAVNADPDLAAQTLGVLERYLGGNAEPRVHELIGRMLTGPHFAAERASLGLLSFVNESSYEGYRAGIANLPPGSKVARNVRAALTEFARHRAGG